ncbi:hypothetical protein GCM10009821_12430 [Aeromicrobium halocynthiae]|uniref:Type IV toxin-antitoxin system AbiEi family antitoxin domain-containing protein n=1 Tax=Aeromicrobium halocynthiae TaxID=560557 RepID=A0ABN2VW14_9ACTN
MDAHLTALAEANGGYLFRHQLLDLGVDDRIIAAWRRAGEVVRIRHGTYATRASWATADDGQRLAIRTRSVLDKLGPGVVATHASAAALHGLDLYLPSAGPVHVTRVDGRAGRQEAGVIHHENDLPDSDVVEVDGRAVSSPLRAVLEVAVSEDVESAMVTISSALRLGLVSETDLERSLVALRHWPGVRRARLAVRLSDPALESVGEVRSLHMMWEGALPHPTLQARLALAGGGDARLDFLWEWWCHVGEFDGQLKYGRLNLLPDDRGLVLTQEKIREDRIRSLGLGMSRWVWADLAPDRRAATAERIRRAMHESRRLYAREARSFAVHR